MIVKDEPQEGYVNDDDKKENENYFKQEGEEGNFKITKYELDDEEDQGNLLMDIDIYSGAAWSGVQVR